MHEPPHALSISTGQDFSEFVLYVFFCLQGCNQGFKPLAQTGLALTKSDAGYEGDHQQQCKKVLQRLTGLWLVQPSYKVAWCIVPQGVHSACHVPQRQDDALLGGGSDDIIQSAVVAFKSS
jgi:hypothetical protein